jgi:hypothetical protein
MSATGLEGGGACAASFHPAEETSITIFQETQFEDDDDDDEKIEFPETPRAFPKSQNTGFLRSGRPTGADK